MNSRKVKTPKYFIVYHPDTKNYERINFKEPSAVAQTLASPPECPKIQTKTKKYVVTE